MQSPLVFFILENRLAAWRLDPPNAPKRLYIQGQQTSYVVTPSALRGDFTDIIDNLRGDGIMPSELHWIIDASSRVLWQDSRSTLEKIALDNHEHDHDHEHPTSCPLWQVLSWEWLAHRWNLSFDQDLKSAEAIENKVLPWLVTADNTKERQLMQDALKTEHRNASQRLAHERDYLTQENERLRAQNAALQQVDMQRLVSFLPALFPRVFTILGAVDLAHLCGCTQPLDLPSPYPEPTEETLRHLQKNFRALPVELQKQIIGFVAHLPQRQKIQPRPEMRELILELEGQ